MTDAGGGPETADPPSPRLHEQRWFAPLAFAVLVALPMLPALALLVAAQHPAPRHVPVAVVAPPIVAVQVAREVSSLPGTPLDAVATERRGHADRLLSQGSVRAVIVIDLARTRDLLLLSRADDSRLRAAITDRVRAIERSRGRTLTVQQVPTVGDDAADVASRLRATALLAGLAGVLLVITISFWRGARPKDLRAGLRRLAASWALALVSAAVAVAAIGGLGQAAWSTTAVVAVVVGCVLTSSLFLYAVEALLGIAGLAVGAAIAAAAASPLITRTDASLLPAPWGVGVRWLPPVAGLEGLDAALRGHALGLVGPLIVLAGWALAGFLVLVAARLAQRRTARHQRPDDPTRGRAEDPAGKTGTDSRRHVPWSPSWRLRVVAVLAPLVAVALLASTALDEAEVPAATAVASRASITKCLGTGRVDTVADLNRIATTLRGGPTFQGADVGADVLLGDGRRVMMFGDTLRAADFQGQQFVRNSMLLFEPGCIQAVLPEGLGALIPDRPARPGAATVGYWPMSVSLTRMPGYELVTVFTQRVRTVGRGPFGFENLGPSVAVFVVRSGRPPQLLTTQDLGVDSADRDRPAWGAATGRDGSYLYVYGTSNPDPTTALGFSLRVARVHPLDVVDQRKWRYWDGSAWVRDQTEATALIDARGGTSQTLSVFPYRGRWLALSKRDEFLGRNVTVWQAPHPWGPFDSGRTVADLPSDAASGELRYMPLAHPDLLRRPGTMVVSYSRNRTDAREVAQNPFLYRPRFLRIRLP